MFVDEDPEVIRTIGAQLKLDVAQLHGAETPERHPQGIRIWRAFRVKDSTAEVVDLEALRVLAPAVGVTDEGEQPASSSGLTVSAGP